MTAATTNEKIAACTVLLSLESDTVTVTSPSGKAITVPLPSLRRASRTLYGKLCEDDTILDNEEVTVELSFDEMCKVRGIAVPLPNTIAEAVPMSEETAPTTSEPTPAVSNEPSRNSDQVADTIKRLQTSNVFGGVNTSDGTERKVRGIQKVLAKISDQPLYVVNYYIPVELSTAQYAEDENDEPIRDALGRKIKIQDIRIPSPAGDFYSVAINLDGSNWFMTEEGLNSPVIQRFFALTQEYADFRGGRGKGARAWAVKQDKEESVKLVEWAMEELRCYLVQLHSSLIANIATADEGLKKAEQRWQETLAKGGQVSDKDTTTEWAKRNNRVRSELKSAADKLNEAIAVAEKYDATECVEDLFVALRAAIRAHELAFNTVAVERGVRGSNVNV